MPGALRVLQPSSCSCSRPVLPVTSWTASLLMRPEVSQSHCCAMVGIGAKRVMAQESVSLNGTEAIHILLEGRLKDTEVRVSSYVAKDGDCAYDLVYVASPELFQDRLPEFERFVRGWILTDKGSKFQAPGSTLR